MKLIERYLSSTGRCFDIGGAVLSALMRYEKSGEAYAGSAHPQSAGNGSLMRLAPLALAYANNPEQAIELSGQMSRTTHGVTVAIDACRYYTALIIGALQGRSKGELMDDRFNLVEGLWDRQPLVKEIDEVARGSFQFKHADEIKGSGYVVESLEASLWAFYTTDSFEEGVLAAVNLGDDADTTGSIYGQLAGAYYDIDSIPQHWRDKIVSSDLIIDLAEKMMECID
ncbi:MAG: ADP-ribosylglycohydrolase family protein [Gammaproteobacteria bacterium]|nr:ADP-ribosylglycohydrolase family protein [Gammaproteobacteria bacterium]